MSQAGEAKKSKMALAVLMITSVAGTEKDPRVRVDDPIGPKLLKWSDGVYAVGRLPALHRRARHALERNDPGAYGFLSLRLRHIDAIVRQEAAAGAKQLVILGAGYDTRAYRMEELADVTVYEVDLPATSLDKQERLSRVMTRTPETVQYVEVDFTRQDLVQRLKDHGCKLSVPTLFVLSGVSMYLPDAAVRELFSQVSQFSSGSGIVLDYLLEDLLSEPEKYPGGPKWLSRASKAGEKLRCGFSINAFQEVVEGCGLELVDQAKASDLAESYLVGTDGVTSASAYEFAVIAHARVP
jgi:methyltransferase (TIGR00027 family)